MVAMLICTQVHSIRAPSLMRIPVRYERDGVEQWTILELQGQLASRDGGELKGMDLGTFGVDGAVRAARWRLRLRLTVAPGLPRRAPSS